MCLTVAWGNRRHKDTYYRSWEKNIPLFNLQNVVQKFDYGFYNCSNQFQFQFFVHFLS